MFALHAPDGFLEAPVALACALFAAAAIGVALRVSSSLLDERRIPLAGIAAAFIFAAQMFNFPVASGTTGHLVGGCLAAILLGPWVGSIVVAIVVLVQALVFADGGLTALGYNVINMAIVPAFGGFALFSLLRRLFPRSATGVIAATALASALSVVLAAAAFSLQWLFGASAPVPFDTVFGAMVGVHLLIGIGEGFISGLAVGAVLAARPDLVFGASDLTRAELADRTPVTARTFLIGGALTAAFFAAVVSQFAFDSPDGLEKVAADTGFLDSARDHAFGSGLFADYATSGIGNQKISLAVAGLTGVTLSALVGYGLLRAVREARSGTAAHP